MPDDPDEARDVPATRAPSAPALADVHPSWRELHSASEWCERLNLCVMNPPRGWTGRYALPWDTPIGIVEFYERMCRSKRGYDAGPGGWAALVEIAHALEDEQHERSGLKESSLLTAQPVNQGPLRVQIALPPGERESGFYLTVPSIPPVDDDFHLTYRDGDKISVRAFRVKSVVWFLDRDNPDNPKTNRVRVNLARPRGPATKGASR